MIKPILTDDHGLLRTVSTAVVRGDPTVKELVRDMLDTLVAIDGIGLAAVQIGTPLRVAIIAHPNWPRPEIVVNPIIVEHTEEFIGVNERCLSVVGRTGYVPRWSEVIVEYLAPTLRWAHTRSTFTGMASIIVQHELDHLDGVLFVDRLPQES